MVQIYADTAAQERIDKEIADVQTTLCALKTRRNTHSAIAHLPDDILALVFLEVRSTQASRWFLVNEVCPIPASEGKICAAGQVASPTYRVRALHLYLIHPQASSLEVLHIQSEADHYHTLSALESLGNWDELPELKHFHLNFPMPVRLPFLPSLTLFRCLAYNLTVSSLLRALACMPSIEDASFQHVKFDADASLPTLPIILPKLKCLNILAMTSNSSQIFASLGIPLTATVVAGIYDDGPLDVANAHTLISQLYGSMVPSSMNGFELKLEVNYTTIQMTFSSPIRDGQRTIILSDLEETGNRLRMFDVLPTELFTSLTCDFRSSFDLIRVLLPRFTRLKKLDMQSMFEQGHMSTLKTLLKADDVATLPPLPELEHLSGYFDVRECVQVLETLLSERLGLGIPIQTIATSKQHETAVGHLPEQFGVSLSLF
ncbi:hypothetical protein ONZ45_g12281 [Pleurotus djamor]|nr:hypothetical protein ONZ45_g12281 [Pleurotus djamor]